VYDQKIFRIVESTGLFCRKSQTLNYFNRRGLDVEPLFFAAYDNTRKVYEEAVVKKKSRYNISNKLCNKDDFATLGILQYDTKFVSFGDAYSTVVSNMERERSVFIFITNAYIPHRGGRSTHSIILEGFDREQGLFAVTDPPAKNPYYYDMDILCAAYDSLPDFKKYITVFDYSSFKLDQESLRNLHSKFHHLFCGMELDLLLFDAFVGFLEGNLETSDQLNEWIEAFSYLHGTRSLFQIYWEKYHSSVAAHNLLEEYIMQMAILRNMLYLVKAKWPQPDKIGSLIERCKKIRQMDLMLYQTIRRYLTDSDSGLYNSSVRPLYIDPPHAFKCTAMTDTSAFLCWEDANAEMRVDGYELYQDESLIAVTNRNSHIVGNLMPDTKYNFNLVSKDAFGNCSKPVALSVATREEDVSESRNFALYKPVETSSEREQILLGKYNIVDGDQTTPWVSDEQEFQFVKIDMGELKKVRHVRIHWGSLYARKYKMMCSENGDQWNAVYLSEHGKAGIEDIHNIEFSGRYLKIEMLESAYENKYTIWEIEIFGRRKPPLHYYKAEELDTHLSEGTRRNRVQQRDQAGAQWRAVDVIRFSAVNDCMTYKLNIEKCGNYLVRIGTIRAINQCRFQLYVNGKKQGGEQDMALAQTYFEVLDLGSLVIEEAGIIDFTIEVSGKSESSKDYVLIVDHIVLIPDQTG
jgi:hypothetical protein